MTMAVTVVMVALNVVTSTDTAMGEAIVGTTSGEVAMAAICLTDIGCV